MNRVTKATQLEVTREILRIAIVLGVLVTRRIDVQHRIHERPECVHRSLVANAMNYNHSLAVGRERRLDVFRHFV